MEGEVLKGHLDMIVLSALTRGSAHGYAIIEEVRRRSGGNFDLPEGTIYPALHRLESAGLLQSEWTESDTGRRRRTYQLTPSGRRALTRQKAMWSRFTAAMDGLIGKVSDVPST